MIAGILWLLFMILRFAFYHSFEASRLLNVVKKYANFPIKSQGRIKK